MGIDSIMEPMKLSVWAELQGLSYKTAWRMWKAGTLPVQCEQLPTETVLVHAEAKAHGVALYARVSSADQKDDLDRQWVRLTEYAISNKLVIVDRRSERNRFGLERSPEEHVAAVEKSANTNHPGGAP